MVKDSPPDVTRLLRAWSDGDPAALQQLMDVAYRDLRRIAQNHFRRERPGHTLQPTALVNELYLRLIGQRGIDWVNRAQFFAVASRLMRRLLVDHARRRGRQKRKGIQVTLTDMAVEEGAPNLDVLALDGALTALEVEYPRESQVVELRYFGGLTHEEVAEQLGVSLITVKRDWRFAKNWLLGELERGAHREGASA